MTIMGYVFDFKDAGCYDDWFENPKNAYAFRLETQMLFSMLAPLWGQRLLDIGCGTGKSLEPFLNYGLKLTGIDPSPYMLDIARERLKHRADLHRGVAEDLPFEDNAFEYSIFFTSLEYTDRPAKAIEEACRVTKDRVFVGVLNRYGWNNILKRVKGLFAGNLYSEVHFFGIWELKQLVYSILGKVPVSWRTTVNFPLITFRGMPFPENLPIVQKSPFGAMIGMVITPVPKFRVKPLMLKNKPAKCHKALTGYARTMKEEKNEDAVFPKTG